MTQLFPKAMHRGGPLATKLKFSFKKKKKNRKETYPHLWPLRQSLLLNNVPAEILCVRFLIFW